MAEKLETVNNAFRAYHSSHRNIVDARLREREIYFGQPPILKYLSENKNATQKEIADAIGVSPPSVANSLKRMEETGLVVRVESKKDARRNSVKLTRKGQELFEYADGTFRRIDYETYKGFTDEELELLASFLQRMNDNLTAYIKEEQNV